jgi:hypothetical protein
MARRSKGKGAKVLEQPAEKLEPLKAKERTPTSDDGWEVAGPKKRPRAPHEMTQERRDHVMNGHLTYTKDGKLTTSGFHHRPGGVTPNGRRIKDVRPHGTNGVYSADVAIVHPDDPNKLVLKSGNGRSTFFPDKWSADEVDEAISDAFKNRDKTKDRDGYWEGESNGVWMNGYFNKDNGKIGNAFPDTWQN